MWRECSGGMLLFVLLLVCGTLLGWFLKEQIKRSVIDCFSFEYFWWSVCKNFEGGKSRK